jgi:UPF0176 protein
MIFGFSIGYNTEDNVLLLSNQTKLPLSNSNYNALGRVYVANEGVNAQLSVPSNVLSNFQEATQRLGVELGLKEKLYFNIDHEMTSAEFENFKPFRALHIRIRDQIVADGFTSLIKDKSLEFDWNNAGYEMPPIEWHKELDNPDNIVLDCRNSYESEVGIFQNAIPLNTTFFRCVQFDHHI